MRKLKIVRIIDRMNIGGPAVHVVLLSADPEFETVLVSGGVETAEGDMEYFARQHGVNPVYITELTREISPVRDLLALWKIIEIIYREKPDIVHTHKSKAGALGRVAAFLLRVPSVHTFHGHVFHSYFGKWKTRIFLRMERLFARFSNAIIVISRRQFWEICKTYRIAPAGKFAIVPLGFDFAPFLQLSHYRGTLRKKHDIANENTTVAIVGRLTAVKNHAMFLRAAREVLKHRMSVTFVLVGNGELRADLISLAKSMGIEKQVVFAGWIEEPAAIYCDMDVVVLTSLNEGTPVTLIEAMFCKKPVVATDVGGVADVVINGKTGILVKKNDAGQLARELCALIDSPEKRRKIGQAAFESVREKYCQDRLVKDMKRLYEKLCRQSKKAKRTMQ